MKSSASPTLSTRVVSSSMAFRPTSSFSSFSFSNFVCSTFSPPSVISPTTLEAKMPDLRSDLLDFSTNSTNCSLSCSIFSPSTMVKFFHCSFIFFISLLSPSSMVVGPLKVGPFRAIEDCREGFRAFSPRPSSMVTSDHLLKEVTKFAETTLSRTESYGLCSEAELLGVCKTPFGSPFLDVVKEVTNLRFEDSVVQFRRN